MRRLKLYDAMVWRVHEGETLSAREQDYAHKIETWLKHHHPDGYGLSPVDKALLEDLPAHSEAEDLEDNMDRDQTNPVEDEDMEKWYERFDELNGAPESEYDR